MSCIVTEFVEVGMCPRLGTFKLCAINMATVRARDVGCTIITFSAGP